MEKNIDIDEIKALIYAIEIRDSYTQGHSEHVAHYAKEFAKFLEMGKKECEEIYIAGLLHDIGKIGIPDAILLKPGKLEEDEFELIKLHSTISGKVVEKIPNFSHLAKIVRHHHEDYNGKGYPDGLKGEEIPLFSRILSLADVFDALTTGRVYRASMNMDRVLSIMEDMQKGGKFDPDLYKKFIPFIKKLGIYHTKINTEFKDLEEKRNTFFYIDNLTKFFNKDALIALLRKCHDYKYYISLIKCDIKQFKFYNKEYGIREGDELLKKISNLFIKNLNPIISMKEPKHKDLFIFRLNADKFILLSIGARSEFLNYKIGKIQNILKTKFKVEFKCITLMRDSKVERNIEEEIGYLL
jgi:diguanylate cyclase (GGDEF)-like protein